MITTALTLLTSLAFGIGVALAVYGLVLIHKIFFAENRFETMGVVMAVSFVCLSLGVTLIHLSFAV